VESAIAVTMSVERQRFFEGAFGAVFSVVILLVFYHLISMNGLVLGNDPAVHLEKALIFLQTGNIPLSNLGWAPPLFSILLSALIAFTNASSIGQLILVVKLLAVLIDWLLFFSVYLLSSKFLGRRNGVTSVVLLLLCFPVFELNLWGGYTTVLGLSFMFLLFLYLPLSARGFGYILTTFLVAFSVVLSHQLTTFVAALILLPVMIYMLVKSRGIYLKALVALFLGGGIAFFLYYFQAMSGYIDMIIWHVFQSQQSTLYQVPATTLNAFMVNFGFVFITALVGVFAAFFLLRKRRQSLLYLILLLSFFVPFVLAESYLFGLYLPFQWFVYYLMPPMVILASVAAIFAFDKVSIFYSGSKKRLRRVWVKAMAVTFVVLVSSMVVFRLGTVYGKIMEGAVYYSTSDPKALEAGLWLKNNSSENATVVVTDVPGFWFKLFSGKTVIASTNPAIQRNEISESVLDLSYEVEKSFKIEESLEAGEPLTLLRAYEAKGATSYESFVSINHVWYKVAYSSGEGDFALYRDGGVERKVNLSSFSRDIIFEDENPSNKRLIVCYENGDLTIKQTITVNEGSFATDVSWTLSPLRSEISEISLYVTVSFDQYFRFEKGYVPGVLNWANPWNHSSYIDVDGLWAVTDFSSSTLTDAYLGFYDEIEDVVFALRLGDMPDWGNVGALSNGQIDAIRLRYNFYDLDVSQNESFAYQILTFSNSNYSPMPAQPIDVKSLFDLKPIAPFRLESRDYRSYIQANNIGFIVYDKNQLDPKIIRCRVLELVFSNDRYVIFRIEIKT
jgi:hypothetical protein